MGRLAGSKVPGPAGWGEPQPLGPGPPSMPGIDWAPSPSGTVHYPKVCHPKNTG